MIWTNRLSQSYREQASGGKSVAEKVHAIQGTIQRVNYRQREFSVIVEDRAWRFVVASNCYLLFNDTPAILRCFHPLDPVRVIFGKQGTENIARTIYSWEPQPNACS